MSSLDDARGEALIDSGSEVDSDASVPLDLSVPIDEAKAELRNLDQIDPERPVSKYLEHIRNRVNDCSVTIVEAETGAGKSTLVPRALMDAGYNVIVTEPRIPAAQRLAERVAEEAGLKFGKDVGYQTAKHSKCLDSTKLRYCTDGLTMVRELMGRGGHRNVLILDEVHEWNTNIEVLIAWARDELCKGADFKLVIMSATMESAKLAAYFSDVPGMQGQDPVVTVPGRMYPVTAIEPYTGGSKMNQMAEQCADLLKSGRNVLVFQPGKSEINEFIRILGCFKSGARVLPLHSELSLKEQKACFKSYQEPLCIVATNIAQTSLTIPCIDAVIDCGEEKRIEVVGGVEGLHIVPVSISTAKQRAERAGRVKPGISVDYCLVPEGSREIHSRPEILRRLIDQQVLRLRMAGYKMEDMQFFHQPSKEQIINAIESLKILGCLDKEGELTELGRQVSRFPVSVKHGRMLVEAEKRGVLSDIVDVVALLEGKGITLRKQRKLWKKFCEKENASDVLAQLAVFKAAHLIHRKDMKMNGIDLKSYEKALECRTDILRALRIRLADLKSTGNREDILKCICAGMVENVAVEAAWNGWKLASGSIRELSQETVIKNPSLLVGSPFDLEIPARGGRRTIHILQHASKIEYNWLVELAPELFSLDTPHDIVYDPQSDLVRGKQRILFNGLNFGAIETRLSKSPLTARAFHQWLSQWMLPSSAAFSSCDDKQLRSVVEANATQQRRAVICNMVVGYDQFEVWSQERLQIWLGKKLGDVSSLQDISNPEKIRLPTLNENAMQEFLEKYPDCMEVKSMKFPISYTGAKLPRVTVAVEQISDELIGALINKRDILPDGSPVILTIADGEEEQVISSEGVKSHVELALLLDEVQRELAFHALQEESEPVSCDCFSVADVEQKVEEAMLRLGWTAPQQPEIGIEDLEDFEPKYPEMVRKSYARSAISGQAFDAFGTLSACLKVDRQGPSFLEFRWYRTEVAAKEANEAARKLVRGQVLDCICEFEKEHHLELVRERRIKDAEKLRHQIETGEALVDYKASFRLVGRNGREDTWVISSDGEERKPRMALQEEKDRQGTKTWPIVGADDLVLSWSCGNPQERDATSVFTIERRPVNGITAEQVKAAAQIETRIQVASGSFGLNEKTIENQDLAQRLRDLFPECPVTGEEIEWNDAAIAALKSFHGFSLAHNHPELFHEIDYNGSFVPWSGQGRAQILLSGKDLGIDQLELLIVDQSPNLELVIRWQE